jgi:sugar (glycoside-pentoside-hexuronide) transporter
MKEKKELGFASVLGYGCGSVGKDLCNGVVQSFLLLFWTDYFGIPASAAAVIFIAAKVWDAINDPMMGAIADRMPITKIGKYRPFVLFTSIPLAITNVLLFLTPGFGTPGKVAYAAITYTLMGMCFTAYDVPFWAMIPSLTKNEKIKNSLISSNRTLTMIAMFVATGFTTKLVEKFGGGNEKAGYSRVMQIFAVISVIFAIIAFLSTKEIYLPESKSQNPHIFKDFAKVACKPLVFVLLGMVCIAMAMTLPAVVGTYYMIYYIGQAERIGLYMICSVSLAIIGTLLAPVLMRRFSAKTIVQTAFVVDIITGASIFFIDNSNIALLLVLFAIAGAMVGLHMVCITSMLVDTIQYIAETKGIRADGVCFSLNSFATKIGQALANGSVSAILAVTGYVAVARQTHRALTGILMTRSLYPALIALIGLTVVSFWKIDITKKKEEAH